MFTYVLDFGILIMTVVATTIAIFEYRLAQSISRIENIKSKLQTLYETFDEINKELSSIDFVVSDNKHHDSISKAFFKLKDNYEIMHTRFMDILNSKAIKEVNANEFRIYFRGNAFVNEEYLKQKIEEIWQKISNQQKNIDCTYEKIIVLRDEEFFLSFHSIKIITEIYADTFLSMKSIRENVFISLFLIGNSKIKSKSQFQNQLECIIEKLPTSFSMFRLNTVKYIEGNEVVKEISSREIIINHNTYENELLHFAVKKENEHFGINDNKHSIKFNLGKALNYNLKLSDDFKYKYAYNLDITKVGNEALYRHVKSFDKEVFDRTSAFAGEIPIVEESYKAIVTIVTNAFFPQYFHEDKIVKSPSSYEQRAEIEAFFTLTTLKTENSHLDWLNKKKKDYAIADGKNLFDALHKILTSVEFKAIVKSKVFSINLPVDMYEIFCLLKISLSKNFNFNNKINLSKSLIQHFETVQKNLFSNFSCELWNGENLYSSQFINFEADTINEDAIFEYDKSIVKAAVDICMIFYEERHVPFITSDNIKWANILFHFLNDALINDSYFSVRNISVENMEQVRKVFNKVMTFDGDARQNFYYLYIWQLEAICAYNTVFNTENKKTSVSELYDSYEVWQWSWFLHTLCRKNLNKFITYKASVNSFKLYGNSWI